jgi:HK97 family phage major capsid protein
MPISLGADPLVIAQQELRIRDIIGKRTLTTGNMYMWIRQTARTNAASPQVEASPKAESTYTWDTQSGTIKTIAHFTNVSRQALDDVPWLRSEIDSELRYGLLLKEEAEILAGSGTGEHLNGIITQATAYASATYNVSGDTKIDKLRHAKLQCRLQGLATYAPDAYVLNPRDLHDLELIKTEEGGANKGLYIVGDPKTGPVVKLLWGLPVVESDSIAYQTFLIGNFATGATLIDRMLATLEISFEHDVNFTKNVATILAEERVGLAVKRPTAFVTGSL